MAELSLSNLRKLLAHSFSLGELRQLAADLEVEPDNISGSTLEDIARELVDYMKRRGRLDELKAKVMEVRPHLAKELGMLAPPPPSALAPSETPAAAPSTPPRMPTPDEIAFSNRHEELAKLRNPTIPQYIVIDAPAGYGKSRLLREMVRSYKDEKWVCTLIDLRDAPARDVRRWVLQQLGAQLAAQGRAYVAPGPGTTDDDYDNEIEALAAAMKGDPSDQRSILLLFDSTEVRGLEHEGWLLQGCAAPIFEHLRMVLQGSRKFRAVFAGRYATARWKAYRHGQVVYSLQLGPFDVDAIAETVQKLQLEWGANLTHEDLLRFSRNLLRITGGHPGCIATLLTDVIRHNFIRVARYDKRDFQHQTYLRVVRPVIQDIKAGIPAEVQPAFQRLSVFRRFTYRMIQRMIADGKIPPLPDSTDDPGWDLVTKLRSQWYLINREREKEFYADAITRQLLALELRQEHPQTFAELTAYAEQVYRTALEYERKVARQLVIELTYQQLQQFSVQTPTKDAIIARIRTTLAEYLEREQTEFLMREQLGDPRADLIQALRETILEDPEWVELLTDLAGHDALDEVLPQEL